MRSEWLVVDILLSIHLLFLIFTVLRIRILFVRIHILGPLLFEVLLGAGVAAEALHVSGLR